MKTERAKSEILSSIRRHLATSRPFDAVHSEHQAHQKNLPAETSALAKAAELNEVSLVARFRENLISIGGNCEIVSNEHQAAEIVQTIIENSNAKRIAVSDSELIGKIKSRLNTNAIFFENAAAETLFSVDLGITSAQFGIAETGTLVLESEKEFHRLTSLVPPIHVCLLQAENLRVTLGEVLEILEKDLSRAITFITGPSRTSDIELTLAIGVHGPAQLHVIILENQAK